MQTIIFPAPEHGPMGEILVRTFDNGTATMSYRERPSSTWSAPIWGEVQA